MRHGNLTLNADVTQLYLRNAGWTPVESVTQRMVLFESPPDEEGRKLLLPVPSSNFYVDVERRLQEVIVTVAQIRNVSENVIGGELASLEQELRRSGITFSQFRSRVLLRNSDAPPEKTSDSRTGEPAKFVVAARAKFLRHFSSPLSTFVSQRKAFSAPELSAMQGNLKSRWLTMGGRNATPIDKAQLPIRRNIKHEL